MRKTRIPALMTEERSKKQPGKPGFCIVQRINFLPTILKDIEQKPKVGLLHCNIPKA